MNQVAQRIGRVVRKAEGKEHALVYVVYVRNTKDDNVLKVVKAAIEKQSDKPVLTSRTRRENNSSSSTSSGRPAHGQKTITKFSSSS
jgi:superfamily II DNA or RNA helicase